MSHSMHAHSRAYLRHQRRRAVAQQFRVTRRWHSPYGDKSLSECRAAAYREAVRTAATPCSCTCDNCTNPRHAFGVQSLREALSVMAFREQLYEAQLAHLDRRGLTPSLCKLRRVLHHLWRGYRDAPEHPADE